MKPENSQSAAPGFEQAAAPMPIGVESVPVLPMPEAAPLGGQERYEQTAEARAQVADAAAAAQVTQPIAAPMANPAGQGAPVDDMMVAAPLTAADDDLIEKEWIDKAKEIIDQTRDDPHSRTLKVNELQRSYLQKRFGKIVGAGE